ncbi:bifunctional helix-turn-helix transcriptional regulator/GNAT family N-acetyltransferase [Planomonospora venezuelensis]|uniref:DNA-binding MarR family transcriptional regulator/N-acetylglutamate synthase-like GNAT family acetyltransferase n=1 Tax=Planomonospora venezuelensis TaxID=1999 RepID=A0A841CWN7_PLAVE|nr:helix-turn-helix domain-containing GNAT family N-acetyltransferase [Planomonospora venezuelensis]MBB5961800.1 DNA-binding MarR family transcriptional regulator/N-acetylglutamate synthase-like GNAT family acetyltransferase [Planomonospora venezuelensis]GIM99536.1 MarR family transcriptional regulator [Planomonospora venezuelensis]
MNESIDGHVAEVRAFNRFYTGVIGLLDQGMVGTPYSLTEGRILFELDRHGRLEAGELRRLLGLDAGYLSRILRRFEADGLVARERSAADARRQVIVPTGAGRAAFELLDERSAEQVRGLLGGLDEEDRRRLVAGMAAVREVLGRAPRREPYVIRPPRAGDLGWVVHRHGVLYCSEYGWGQDFEALVARIVADYADRRDPRREAGWIAEVDGERAGCVFCVRKDDETAQLRLLLVEPSARGMGIGGRLVDECLRFAREAGYRRITLWTRDVLTAARRIYRAAGFELAEEEPGAGFTEQVWTRGL